MPYLSRITLHPIKSLDGVCVEQALITTGGALEHDREWAICDEKGEILRAKRRAEMHLLRASYNLPTMEITLKDSRHGNAGTFCLDGQRAEIEAWLSQFFGFAVRLMRNADDGFADDPNLTGPTVVATSTIEEVAGWFPGLDADSVRSRFRANLEIGDAPAFWEDRLFKQEADRVEFEIGNVRLESIAPCDRCVVVTRDANTGESLPGFERIFMERREATLPAWTERSRLPNFFHLCVRTHFPQEERSKSLKVGDKVEILSVRHDVPFVRRHKNFREKHQQVESRNA